MNRNLVPSRCCITLTSQKAGYSKGVFHCKEECYLMNNVEQMQKKSMERNRVLMQQSQALENEVQTARQRLKEADKYLTEATAQQIREQTIKNEERLNTCFQQFQIARIILKLTQEKMELFEKTIALFL